MSDLGHEQTDKELKKIENIISKEYKQASQEIEDKMLKHFEDFNAKDIVMRKKVESGQITESQYNQWRIGQMATGERWISLRDSLTSTLVNADKVATQIIQGNSIKAYGDNMNYGTYEIEHGSKINTGFVLYDSNTVINLMKDDPKIIPMPRLDIPKDEQWNRQHLSSAVLQGILQGESIPEIADRLQNVAFMGRNSAIRNARTYTTAAENKGRIDSYERAEKMGIKTNKKWIATLDDRTRAEHRHLDGMSVPPDEKFETDGYTIGFPGDPSAEPEMFYNCRCTLVADIVGYPYNDERNDSKLGDMTYEEWKHAKDKPQKEETKIDVEEKKEETTKESGTNDEKGKPNSATEYYVSGEGMWINQYLRGRGDFGNLTESEEQFLKDLDTATDGNVKIDTLYRSVDASAIFGNMSQSTYDDLRQYVVYGEDSFGKGKYADSVKEKMENLINKTEGKEILEKGFMSTTKDKDIAMEFGDFTGSEMPIVMKIDTGGNAHGVDISIYDKNVDESEKQEEVLLARNQSYIVERIYAEDHNICVDVKIVNDNQEEIKEEIKSENETKSEQKEWIKHFEFTPAETIEEAEQYAKDNFIQSGGFYNLTGKTISYKGIDLDMANRINERLTDIYGNFDVNKLSSLESYGKSNKKIYKEHEQAGMLTTNFGNIGINREISGSQKSIDKYNSDAERDFQFVMDNIESLTGAKRELAEAYKEAGRSLVGNQIEDFITHEMGHHISWMTDVNKEIYNISKQGDWKNYARSLSGYSNATFGEYFAESFNAYYRGETDSLQPEIIDIFERLRKE